MIIKGLKKRLYDENNKKGGKWIHELPHVVWGLRTQPSKATGQISFFLVYGSEAILPADIMWKSPRVEMYNEGEADEARQLELDSVEEARCTALVQSARYLQGIRRYHDRNVRERSFSIGDLVLAASKTSPAYTSSIRDGKDSSSSSRLQDQGLINYNIPRAKTSQIPRTYRTYASFTHKKTRSDSCASSARAVFFRFNLEAMCHRIQNVNFLLKYRGYSHVLVLYESTPCHEHSCRCDDDRVFPSRLDPLDRTQSNLFDRLT
jgi:hypothetical protein